MQQPLGVLRSTALVALLAGAAGSLWFLFHASQHPPQFLLFLFVIWVLGPFVALGSAELLSRRWQVPTRATLYVAMLLMALGSLSAYGADAAWPRKAQPAFMYVLVPPVSGLLSAIAVAIAAFISRGQSHRAAGDKTQSPRPD